MIKYEEWEKYYLGEHLNMFACDDTEVYVIENEKIIFKGTYRNLRIEFRDLLEKRVLEWYMRFSRRVRRDLAVAVVEQAPCVKI